MPGHWKFNEADPSDVLQEVTQRDQFNNDDVGLAEALVRETIQNSLDAPAPGRAGPVKVSFSIKELNNDETKRLHRHLEDLTPHLEACDLPPSKSLHGPTTVLCIEDFNTTGLTGQFDDRDNGNFESFWRVIGKSPKTGQKAGRWGLGKLVYSSSSQVRSFFGLTVRDCDAGPSIMGQAVLQHHCIGERYFPPHGFWFDGRSSNSLSLQLPSTDAEDIGELSNLFGITRNDQCGLSIAIPHLRQGITHDAIIGGVVNNYCFPILAEDLTVEIGEALIDTNTFLRIANQYNGAGGRTPFSFVKEISDALKAGDSFATLEPITDAPLGSEHFSETSIEKMKAIFSSGDLVHVRAGVDLRRKGGDDVTGSIDLFLRKLQEDQKPFSLFARGPITLPGESGRYGSSISARSGLIAREDAAAEFLGDAENPAHTGWNASGEKLSDRWSNPQQTLRAIRHSLRSLYGMIADQREMLDEDVLIDFFSIAEKIQGDRKRGKKIKKTPVNVPPSEPAIRIREKAGGFELTAGPGAGNWTFPKTIRLRLAYDMVGANPFRHFSRFDFDLTKPEGRLSIESTGGDVRAVAANVLGFRVQEPSFSLSANGFDARRDLIVDARAM